MIRRLRLGPLLLVALFAISVCVVSLAHAETDCVDACVATKAGHEPAPASPGGPIGVPVGHVALVAPAPRVALHLPDPSAERGRSGLAEPRTPRAPPA